MTFSDYQKLEVKEKPLEELNIDTETKRLKELCEITEASHQGAKFRRFFEKKKKN